MRDALLTASWQAGAMALLVWLLTALLGRRIAARWRCALWSLVFVRLVLPALPPSPFSLFNLNREAVPTSVVTSPVAAADEVVTFGVIPDASAETSAGVNPAPAPAAAAAAAAAPFQWLTALWLAVATFLILRTVVAWLVLTLKLRRLPELRDPRLSEMLDGSPLRAVETDLVSGPALVGVFRPRLLLPPRLLDRLAPAELRFVVLHELAHHRRLDVLTGAVVSLVAAVHWFNPLAWFAASRFRAERELACDELVLGETEPRQRGAYGRTILRLLELIPQRSHRSLVVGAVGVVSPGRRTIRRRIAAVAGFSPGRSPLGPIALALVTVATLTGPAPSAAPAPPVNRPADAPASRPPNQSVEKRIGESPLTTDAAGDPADVLTRVYNVRDLITEVPDFNPPLDEDGFPTSQPESAPATTRPVPPAHEDRVRKLIADITGSVDPMSWRDNTGAVGSIRELAGQLVVTQTRANHERIGEKLNAMRGARAVQVTLEARFLTRVDAEAVLDGRWPQRVKDREYDLWPGFLSGADVDRLLRASQADRKSTTVSAPRITLFDGQRAYVLVTRQNAYVADLTPSRDKPGDFEEVVKLLTSGVKLDARAKVVSDDDGGAKYVTLMLNPTLSTLLDLRPQRWPDSPQGRDNLIVQVPHRQVTRLETTITVPDGQTALFRLHPVHKPAHIGPADPVEPTLLLVRPTVIEAGIETPKEFPVLSNRAAPTAPASDTADPAPAPRPLDSHK